MELKSLCEELQDVRADSFNRTFMELKSDKNVRILHEFQVF